jgi:hypothetical protein
MSFMMNIETVWALGYVLRDPEDMPVMDKIAV